MILFCFQLQRPACVDDAEWLGATALKCVLDARSLWP